MTNEKVSLQVDSGAIIEIDRQAAKQSSLIKTVLEKTKNDECEAIPVDDHVLRKVVAWCEHRNDSLASNNNSNGTDSLDQVTNIGEWDRHFFPDDYNTIFEIILAANYLEIQALLDIGCLSIAKRIAQMPLESIRAEFNIPETPIAAPDASVSPTNPSISSDLPPSDLFNPTPIDVSNACLLLHNVPLQSKRPLPMELAAEIIALAYPPLHVAHCIEQRTYHANDYLRPGPEASVAGLYLSTRPLPQPNVGTAVAQRVVFQTRAADQGWATWGGDGTFHNSHTWFEASILRPVSPGSEGRIYGAALQDQLGGTWETPLEARAALNGLGWDFVENPWKGVAWRVCNNITASSAYRGYRVKWERGVITRVGDEKAIGKGHGFLEYLESGFVVVLWARAEQRAWVNRVGAASIEIQYTIL